MAGRARVLDNPVPGRAVVPIHDAMTCATSTCWSTPAAAGKPSASSNGCVIGEEGEVATGFPFDPPVLTA